MKKLIPVIVVSVFAGSAMADKEFCETGTTRCLTIPSGMKLIQVPWLWDPDQIVLVQRGAQPPGTPIVCADDKCPPEPEPCDGLVIGPGVCQK